MASSKYQSLSIYGAFYLPLAVLSGLSLSVFLSYALSFLIPVVESALFTSLPQLWSAFLSWVTPPCLFVLLNGIIVVLTASSGMLSSSDSESGSDFYTNLLARMENSHKGSPASLMADSQASDYLYLKMKIEQKQPFAATNMETHHLSSSQAEFWAHSAVGRVETQISESPQAMLPAHTPCVFYDADAALETEQKKIFDKEADDDGGDDTPSSLAMQAMGSTSFCHAHTNTRICLEEEEEDEEGEEENNERISGLPKLAVANKKSILFSSRSEPSSPQFATPPTKSNAIKRSLSVDSASFQDNKASSCSPEDLSDEAFRKRIEDFISKMNAQLRSEAK